MKKDKVKKFGEVFTPVKLVNEMLDTLPVEVWSNSGLTWLDPCTGRNGIFVVEVAKRLMENGIPYKHIMENMIYVCELQEDAVEQYKKIVDPNNEYKLNIFCGSFLSKEFDEYEW